MSQKKPTQKCPSCGRANEIGELMCQYCELVFELEDAEHAPSNPSAWSSYSIPTKALKSNVTPPSDKPVEPSLSRSTKPFKPVRSFLFGTKPSSLRGSARFIPLWDHQRRPLLIGAIFSLILILGILTFSVFRFPFPQWGFNQQLPSVTSVPHFPKGIGVFKAPNGEDIGISDGTFAFDTGPGRVDSDLKRQAADKLKAGDVGSAISLWQEAIANDRNDGEAHIYLENQKILSSSVPYITLIVAITLQTKLNPYPDATSREDLRGAFIAQQEYNRNGTLPNNTKVRLLIARSGTDSTYVNLISQQIVQAAQSDRTIVGVMGWPYTSKAHNQIQILSAAKLPQVSPSAGGDALTSASPYFFRSAPPNRHEAQASADYVQQTMHANRVALFYDPAEEYSQSFAADFKQYYSDATHKIVKTEEFTTGNTKNFQALLNDALKYKPDLIEFVVSITSDVKAMLALLPTSGEFANLPLMAGDSAYSLVDTTGPPTGGFNRLNFASLAYPDEWTYENLPNPPFFADYADAFDDHQPHDSPYAHSRPDDSDMLSYDATLVLLKGCEIAMRNGKTVFTPDDLQKALLQIKGQDTVQGVSGQITIGADHDPVNKVTLILYVTQGHIRIAEQHGCFLAGKC